ETAAPWRRYSPTATSPPALPAGGRLVGCRLSRRSGDRVGNASPPILDPLPAGFRPRELGTSRIVIATRPQRTRRRQPHPADHRPERHEDADHPEPGLALHDRDGGQHDDVQYRQEQSPDRRAVVLQVKWSNAYDNEAAEHRCDHDSVERRATLLCPVD